MQKDRRNETNKQKGRRSKKGKSVILDSSCTYSIKLKIIRCESIELLLAHMTTVTTVVIPFAIPINRPNIPLDIPVDAINNILNDLYTYNLTQLEI